MVQTISPTPTQWDAFVKQHKTAHVLQLSAWGTLKAAYGWRVERIGVVDDENNLVAGAQVLLRKLPYGLGMMAYLPMNPTYASPPLNTQEANISPFPFVSKEEQPASPPPDAIQAEQPVSSTSDAIQAEKAVSSPLPPVNGGGGINGVNNHHILWQAIDETLKQKYRIAFLKWDEPIFIDETVDSIRTSHRLAPTGFRPSLHTIQPPRTIIIDIQDDDDTIMARMNQGTRRKIRQSLKKDVQYFHASKEDVPKFTRMMNTTGQRNEFGVHEPAYYELAYDLFVPEDATLILAEHEGDVLAGIMVFAVGDMAWYLYGASSNEKRNLMASYGIQWHAIQWAKERGCKYYDLWGIPDEDPETLEEQFQERSDGLWGVYGFKRGWGGAVVRSSGTWDRIYNPIIYRIYKTYLKYST